VTPEQDPNSTPSKLRSLQMLLLKLGLILAAMAYTAVEGLVRANIEIRPGHATRLYGTAARVFTVLVLCILAYLAYSWIATWRRGDEGDD
jgi:hypothetical protein